MQGSVHCTRYIAGLYESDAESEKTDVARNELINVAKGFFRDYNAGTDKKLFDAVMTMYGENLDAKWQAPEYFRIRNACKGNFRSFAEKMYGKTIFTDEERFISFVNNFNKESLAKLNRDPFYRLAKSAGDFLAANVRGELNRISSEIQRLNKDYMTLQMEFDKERVFYPDANSTLRVAYGNVQGFREIYSGWRGACLFHCQ